jgi:hypothetical protein
MSNLVGVPEDSKKNSVSADNTAPSGSKEAKICQRCSNQRFGRKSILTALIQAELNKYLLVVGKNLMAS